MKKIVSIALVLVMLFCMVLPGVAETTPVENPVVEYYALRTANNPGYYYSGALLNLGVTVTAGAIDAGTFRAKARITEANGDVQGTFGNFGWDPEKAAYALADNWAKWNILDAYVTDQDGNPVSEGQYVRLDIEWQTRTVRKGESDAERFDVPATRAAWYSVSGYMSFATIELDIDQLKTIPGISDATYVQGETRHDPLFSKFTISDAPGGGTYALYAPENASAENKRPIIVWFHGTGERYHGTNPGGNLVGNRALSFADEPFQDMLDGCYVLAPQSTTSGWNSGRLDDMEALIKQVVDSNYIDRTRIYVGGLSMGTGMTTPLILSQTDNQIDYAAAILCSGGSMNTTQAAIVANKDIPMYLVGSTSDWATYGFTSMFNNLLAAGVDVNMERYPAGPVFDGQFYYGAHDAWNYIYNNLVTDDAGETIYEWIARQSRSQYLDVTTTANLIKKGDYFDIAAAFSEVTATNAATVEINYDASKFEYVRNLGGNASEATYIDNVSYLKTDLGDGSVKLTLMIADKNAKDLVSLRFRAKADANLKNEDNSISATARYVFTNPSGDKIIKASMGSTSFTSLGIPGDTDGDGEVTLIDLSNIIDLFGVSAADALWTEAKYYDLNKNMVIDIADIVAIARMID